MNPNTKYYNQKIWCCEDVLITTNNLMLDVFNSSDQYGISEVRTRLSITNYSNHVFNSVTMTNLHMFDYMNNIKKILSPEKNKFPSFNGEEFVCKARDKKIYTRFINTSQYDKTVLIILSSKGEDFFDSEKFYMEWSSYLSFLKCIQYIRDNHIDLCMSMRSSACIKLLEHEIKTVKDTVDSIYKFHLSMTDHYKKSYESARDEGRGLKVEEYIGQEEDLQNEEHEGKEEEENQKKLDSFLEDKLDDIKISEAEEIKKSVEKKEELKQDLSNDIIDPFTKDVIKKDFLNLDKLITSVLPTENPVQTFFDKIEDTCGIDLLPGGQKDDLKCMYFSSTMNIKWLLNKHLNEKKELPNVVFPFRCDIKHPTEKNKQLAQVLFSYLTYYIILCNQLETKTTSSTGNKTLHVFIFKILSSALINSYLKYIPRDVFLNSIDSHLSFFQKSGVFENFEKDIQNKFGYEVSIKKESIEKISSKMYDFVVNKWKHIHIRNYMDRLIDDKIITDNYEEISNSNIREDQIGSYVSLVFNYMKHGQVRSEDLKEQKDKIIELPSSLLSKYPIEDLLRDNDEFENFKRLCFEYIENEKCDKEFCKEQIDNFIAGKQVTYRNLPLGVLKCMRLWDPKNEPSIRKNYIHFKELVEGSSLSENTLIELLENQDLIDTSEDYFNALKL